MLQVRYFLLKLIFCVLYFFDIEPYNADKNRTQADRFTHNSAEGRHGHSRRGKKSSVAVKAHRG